MSTGDSTQAIYRLAQYRPFDEGGRDISAAIRDLVLASAAVEGAGFASLQACADAIKTLWGLEVEIDELRAVVKKLADDGLVLRTNGGFDLTPGARTQQEKLAEEGQAVETHAFQDWRASIAKEVSDLSDEEWNQLCQDFNAWLGRVISRHGVESALILYPENPRAQQVFDSIEELGLRFLPDRQNRVDKIRDWAFQQFVKSPSPSQRTYLASLLNTSFYMTVLTLDPQASHLLQEKVGGQRIYLDTNFIYSLLGLGVTASEAISAARLIELTQGVGYELAVTKWTIDELRTSLKAAERRLTRLPLPRQDLAELMVMRSGENQITKAYWMKYRNSGITPKDFLDYYSHVEALLEDFDIEPISEGCVAVEQDKETIGEQLSLIERFMPKDKEEVVKEHDVKHRMLIERLRGSGHLTFSNARYWFLTRDTKLPRYAMATVNGSRIDLPFCVASSAWVQVMRAFTPRTEDFDNSLVELLATPYLRYRSGPGVSPEVVNAVVARISQYEGATAELAAEVLADTALTADIASAQSEQELDSKIENALVMKAKEFEQRAAASEQREAELQRERAVVAAEARRTRERGERDSAAANALQIELAKTAHAHEEARRTAEEERVKAAELEKQAELQTSQHQRTQDELLKKIKEEGDRRTSIETRLRLLGAAFVATIAILIGLLPIVIDSWRSSIGLTLCESVAALGLCGALRLGLGEKHGPRILSFIFGFSGIIGLILAIVLAASNS
jgi:hypothetical protein